MRDYWHQYLNLLSQDLFYVEVIPTEAYNADMYIKK